MTIVRYWFSDSGGEGALWSGQLKGEDEAGYFLEVAAQVADLADDIFQTDDVSAQMLLHLCVGLYLHSLFAHLAVKLLVDELTDQFFGRLTPGYVVLYSAQLTDVGWSAFHENSSVDPP